MKNILVKTYILDLTKQIKIKNEIGIPKLS